MGFARWKLRAADNEEGQKKTRDCPGQRTTMRVVAPPGPKVAV